ncbi:MAG: hypothetical protein HC856_01555 [Pseudanabaena sp. RU_4_16]|nr:hypothetical protein [Pseudanabaena sp. RU_4_16]
MGDRETKNESRSEITRLAKTHRTSNGNRADVLPYRLRCDRPVASKAKKIETATISEVSPPSEIQRLNQIFDRYEPQLTIVSPQPDTIIQEDKVTLQLSVTDLPVFKSSLGLGRTYMRS